jgi:hypothetical protein
MVLDKVYVFFHVDKKKLSITTTTGKCLKEPNLEMLKVSSQKPQILLNTPHG